MATDKKSKKEKRKQPGEPLTIFDEIDTLRIVQGGELNILAEATKGLSAIGELGGIEVDLFENLANEDGSSSSSSSSGGSGEDGDPSGTRTFYLVFKEDKATQILRVADITSKKSPEKTLLIVTKPNKKKPILYIMRKQESFWVLDPKKRKIGNIRRNRFEGATNYELILADSSNNTLATLHSTVFSGAKKFSTKMPDKSKTKAKLIKKFSFSSFFSTSCDEYKVCFPERGNPQLKTLFFSSAIIVDQMFHEGASMLSNIVTATSIVSNVAGE
eukprot:TRINITY_DN53_c0_g2_i1.p1 TRINITY_DN53_c0_g2~~TRINITY_DN53_c0_g2_i1.p1  ORF type:complete len:273 (-),score=116.97 TRINITY_DN53_c0_g2_i1:131-949(-)